MSPELDHDLPAREARVRAALDQLARGALAVPTQSLPVDATRSAPTRDDRRVRLVAVAAAVVLVVGAGALLVRRNNSDRNGVGSTATAPADPPADPSVDTLAPNDDGVDAQPSPGLATGWFAGLAPDTFATLPSAPIGGRIGPAAVWSGAEMLVWGGSDLVGDKENPLSDGAAFDPVTGVWRVLPVSPIEGRAYSAVVWTGNEMIVWGGSQNGTAVDDGAAYNPTTDTWRLLPASPLAAAMKSATVWTGAEMVIVGGLNGDASAAAYDPVGNQWRVLPDAPGPITPPYPTAVWTGEAVLMTVASETGPTSSISLAMYRPDVDEWEVVARDFPSQFLVDVDGVDLGMAGDEVVALTFNPDASMPVLSLFGDIGNALHAKPADLATVAIWQPVWTGHEILMWSGNDLGLAFDPLADHWREFPAGNVANRTDGAIVWADGVMLAWGGFVSNRDGTATAAADGIMYRPVDAVADETVPTSSPGVDTIAGCPDDHPGDWTPGPDGFTDYIDFVQLNGRSYDWASPATLAPDQLGELVGRVCFSLGDMTFSEGAPIQDGDSSFLPVGTELRAIVGGNSDLRIAAVTGGTTTVYEATSVEGAAVGAELIDLGTGVAEIWVNSDYDGSRIAPITDPAIVSELVQQLVSAPVDLSPRPGSEMEGRRYMIELVRNDGTSTVRAYWIDTGQLWPGIDLPPTWATAVEAALAAAESDLSAP